MSETRTYDLGDPEWEDVASYALEAALMSRYKELRDQYKQETEGYSLLDRDKRWRWRSAAGEDIGTVRSKYPDVVYKQNGERDYWTHAANSAATTIDIAASEVNIAHSMIVGRPCTCTIEESSNPASFRILIEVGVDFRITIWLTEAKPYRLRWFRYLYEPADQIGGCRERH